jgi:hypothetical protein
LRRARSWIRIPGSNDRATIAAGNSALCVRRRSPTISIRGIGVIGNEKLTRVGNMKLTQLAEWFPHGGGPMLTVEGRMELEVLRKHGEHPGAGAGDGSFAEHGTALFARRGAGGAEAEREAG